LFLNYVLNRYSQEDKTCPAILLETAACRREADRRLAQKRNKFIGVPSRVETVVTLRSRLGKFGFLFPGFEQCLIFSEEDDSPLKVIIQIKDAQLC
jgi:hypothetical protein